MSSLKLKHSHQSLEQMILPCLPSTVDYDIKKQLVDLIWQIVLVEAESAFAQGVNHANTYWSSALGELRRGITNPVDPSLDIKLNALDHS